VALRGSESKGGGSHLLNRSSYSEVTLSSRSTIIFVKEALLCSPRVKRSIHTA